MSDSRHGRRTPSAAAGIPIAKSTEESHQRDRPTPPQTALDDLMVAYESQSEAPRAPGPRVPQRVAESPSSRPSLPQTHEPDFPMREARADGLREAVLNDRRGSMISQSGDDSCHRLPAAYAHCIRQCEWALWASLTFRGNPSQARALRVFRCWMHILQRRAFGRHYWNRKPRIRWVRGMERQRRGTWHFHVLLAAGPRVSAEYAAVQWRRLAGDADIRAYNPSKGAAYYLYKTYSTEVGGEVDLGGSWALVS